MALCLQYISVGCNQSPHNADWSLHGILAYGAGISVALARSDGKSAVCLDKVYCTLRGHSGPVNCVRWVSQECCHAATPPLLLSGAVDGHVIVWACAHPSVFTLALEFSCATLGKSLMEAVADSWLTVITQQYELQQVLQDHSRAVICVDGISNNSSTTIVSASSDSSLKIWESDDTADSSFRLIQTESFGLGFVLAVSLHCLGGSLILACGTEAWKVEIFVKHTNKFLKVHSLVGHEDWVKDVHFTREGSGCLLASCSQDCFIRLWRIGRDECRSSKGIDELTLSAKSFTLVGGDGIATKYNIILESVLIGHDDWVSSVRWMACSSESHPPCLLSASMDKTMVLWMLDADSGLWLEKVRVGEVGGTSLGLYGAVFGPRGDYFLAHSYHGFFNLWKKIAVDHWQPVATISGHYGPVQDIAWEPTRGDFLVSVSLDQTTRIHAPWMVGKKEVAWRELSRPQIHGYNMQCVCMLTPVLLISGADEKVLRVFHSPRNFVDSLLSISQVDLKLDHIEFPPSASVASLGLSNKAAGAIETFDTDAPSCMDRPSGEAAAAIWFVDFSSLLVKCYRVQRRPYLILYQIVSCKVTKSLKEAIAGAVNNSNKNVAKDAPAEDQLQCTLWPEVHKLYGHSYEIFCLASSPDGKLVASACVASKQVFAAILIWNTSQWQKVDALIHHTLTVTQLAFSHSSKLLLAVSRDRTWSLWKMVEGSFQLQAQLDKKTHVHIHSRIIWSCSWTHDDSYFVTGSRDKKVHVWSMCDDGEQCCVDSLQGLQFDHAVMAVDLAPCYHNDNKYLLAVGLESGEVLVYQCSKEPGGGLQCELWCSLDKKSCHTSAVKRIKWSPNSDRMMLASCSLDHSVKIIHVVL